MGNINFLLIYIFGVKFFTKMKSARCIIVNCNHTTFENILKSVDARLLTTNRQVNKWMKNKYVMSQYSYKLTFSVCYNIESVALLLQCYVLANSKPISKAVGLGKAQCNQS